MRLRYFIIAVLGGWVFASASQAQTIVIDAGHGGEDDGYYSWTGHPEDELVLRIATYLESQLSDMAGLDVQMTRSGEGGPSDETRLAIANAAGADLLLSIHADVATERAAARGLIVYTVSDLSRRRVLARTQELGFAPDAATASLALDERLEREAIFIDMLQAQMPGNVPLVVDNGRGGLFDILMDANTPSLFLEFPYLSNSPATVSPALTDDQIAVIDAVAEAIRAHYSVDGMGGGTGSGSNGL